MKYVIFHCGKDWGIVTSEKAIALTSEYDNNKVGSGHYSRTNYHWFPKSMVKISDGKIAGDECRDVQIPYWLFRKKSIYPNEIWAYGYEIVDMD